MNSDEEISSPSSRKLISKIAQQQDVIFSFEGGEQMEVYAWLPAVLALPI